MMDTQTPAQIFLADQRGCSETSFFRSHHTFNFGLYAAEGRKPFGALCLLNEDHLRAGASLTLSVEANTEVLLLPVVGGLEYKSDVSTGFLEPGQIAILSLTAGMNYTVSNPYETESISCLQLWLTNSASDFSPAFSQTNFELTGRNRLLQLFESPDTPGNRGCIGKYDGREEGTYAVTLEAGKSKGLFAFVLQGAFEVANRLLHEKDGLALDYHQDGVLEFEALSNNALLILIEVVL